MASSGKTVSKSQFGLLCTNQQLVVCGLCASLLLCLVAGPAIANPPPKPNIVFILADDLGYGDVGCFGQVTIQTPRIDQLADEGMTFTQFYAGSTVCAPSRCVLMTGFHTGHATVRANAKPNIPLRREDITVPEMLKRANYATGFLGKWSLGGEDDQGNPFNVYGAPYSKGFDFSYGYLYQTFGHDYYPEWLWRNDVKEYIPENNNDQNNINSHDLFTDEALNYVTNASEPFYLQLSYCVPHKKLRTCPIDPPYASQSWPDIEKQFATMITRMDYDVGRIADAIDARGIGSNTLIIFTSDNGPQQEELEHSAEFFNSNGPLRGIKRDLYEGGIREPFIARWTGTISPGTTSTHISAFEDFMPTAAEIAGIKPPGGIDGISFLPTLTGQGTQQQHTHLYWEFSNKKAVRMGDWKAVMIDNSLQLFNLATDLSEQNNVAGPNPSIVTQMVQLMTSSRSSGNVAVAEPVLSLTGDIQVSGHSYGMDFSNVPVGSDPVTLTFRVRNDAQGYSNLMEGQVTAFQVTDPRFSVQVGSYDYLVDGGESDVYQVTFTPTSDDPVIDQYMVIDGYQYIYGQPAVYNPTTLTFGPIPIPADLDEDFDVDQEDHGLLQACYSGFASYAPGCESADLDDDGMVNQSDFNIWTDCLAGANNPPDC